ncbi:MAG: thiamine phosphate synthase [Pyrinomonadaceae bacterium]|nr:thiamine phosphate synthase [Pyrinomonadaceae bacterium]
MSLNLPQPPLSYLITSGATTPASTPASEDFQRVLALIASAVRERVSLVQLREKNLSARVLFQLATQAAEITRGTKTRLLVNDRPDIARAARADGVHLTTRSLSVEVVRRAFGSSFLIGVSTHTLAEALAAHEGGADFAVFGPIFETPSKEVYGPPVGLEKLREASDAVKPFPLLALGGITRENTALVLRAGASGIAGIRLFSDEQAIRITMETLHP